MPFGTTLRKIALGGLIVVCTAGSARPVGAGPLCDWLFGRPAPPPPAYASGYAAAYPVAPATYSANYGAVPAAPVGSAVTVPTTQPAAGYTANNAPVVPASPSNGAAALQMPSYSSNYGAAPAAAPGDRGYAAFTPPVRGSYPPSGIPVTSYYGTGNYYPDASGGAAPASTAGAVAPVTAYQPAIPAPSAAVPAAAPAGSTVQLYPGVPAARPGLLGGISRFFGSLFGTRYSSSYYRAPVTYYRPVTTSGAAGQPVTTQRACTSYEYQMQRAPITSFAPATSAPATGAVPTYPEATCGREGTAFNPYGGSGSHPGQTYAPATGGVVPATGSQPGTYYGPAVTDPASPTGDIQDAPLPPSGGDAAPLQAPSLLPETSYRVRPQSSFAPSTSRNSSGSGYATMSRDAGGQLSPTSSARSRSMAEQPEAASQASPRAGARPRNPHVRPVPATTNPFPAWPEASPARASDSPARASDSPARASDPPARASEPPVRERPVAPAPQPTERRSEDRIAQADWGSKPIRWAVQPASYDAAVTEPTPRAQPAGRPRTEPSITLEPPAQRRAEPAPSRVQQKPTRRKTGGLSRQAYEHLGWSRTRGGDR
jgi:hypothetical protein